MSIFSQDSFSENADVNLSSHVGELGATWTVPSYSGGSLFQIAAADDFVRFTPTGTAATTYLASGTSSTVNHTVELDIKYLGSALTNAGVVARCSATVNTTYIARYNSTGAGYWELYKVVNGTGSLLGAFAQVLTVGVTYRVKLEIKDATKKLFIDGTPQVSSTDNAITATDFVGLRGYQSVNGQTNLTLDNFTATDESTGGNSASIAVTLPRVTAAFTAIPAVVAQISSTLNRVTTSFIVNQPAIASLAVTLPAAISAFTVSVGSSAVNASIAATLAAVISNFQVVPAVAANLNIVLPRVVANFQVTLTAMATISTTLGRVSASFLATTTNFIQSSWASVIRKRRRN